MLFLGTNSCHDGDCEQQRKGKCPPGTPAINGSIVFVIDCSIDYKIDKIAKVAVDSIHKPFGVVQSIERLLTYRPE